MPLSSLHFIFILLPVFLALYYILPFGLWRSGILLSGSLIFFGWVDPKNLPLLLLIILLDTSQADHRTALTEATVRLLKLPEVS